MFERKEKETETNKANWVLWSILKWYWLIVPTFYFLFMVPGYLEDSSGLEPAVAFNLIFQLINYAFAGIMTVTNPTERSKTGLADKFLKAAAVQQFMVQNILGLILTVLVWYQLPYRVNPETVEPEEKEKWYFQPKTIYIITGVLLGITLLVVVGQLQLFSQSL